MKIVQLLAALAIIVLAAPFFEYASIDVANAKPVYTTVTGYRLAYESVAPFFISGFKLPVLGIVMSVLLLVLYVALLFQIIFALTEKPRFIKFTAIPLFAAPFIFSLFVLKNDDISIIQWGYYAFMILEALLIILSPLAKPIKFE